MSTCFTWIASFPLPFLLFFSFLCPDQLVISWMNIPISWFFSYYISLFSFQRVWIIKKTGWNLLEWGKWVSGGMSNLLEWNERCYKKRLYVLYNLDFLDFNLFYRDTRFEFLQLLYSVLLHSPFLKYLFTCIPTNT